MQTDLTSRLLPTGVLICPVPPVVQQYGGAPSSPETAG